MTGGTPSGGSGNLKPQVLMDEIAKSGVKYNAYNIVAITKNEYYTR